jgi:hypothetical protein
VKDLKGKVDFAFEVVFTKPIWVADIYLVEKYKIYHLSFFVHR